MNCRRARSKVSLIALLAISGWLRAHQGAAAIATRPSDSPSSSVGERELLPPDPADVRGEFPNGLHYVIRKNANPPGKVSLNLAVRTGSFNETDQQNGLAHFLEHMAFKGSTHFAPTRLIPMLTHLGMQFGADTNAHTNQYETVFKLTMPDTKPETIKLALTIFSDYANGLSLYPIQIESERRVILEEFRARMNVDRRETKEVFNQLFPGSRLAVHDVLGDPEIIKHAPQSLFKSYWDQWYRPEKMTLVVVGDIDPNAIIAQAQPLLGTFTARTPAELAKTAGLTPFEHQRAIVISDPEQVTGDVELLNLQPVRPPTTTVAEYRRELLEGLAEAMVNRRLSDQITRGNAPFQSASVSSNDLYRDGYLVSVDAVGEPRDWKKTLAGVVQEVNSAVENGFTEHEWKLVRDAAISAATQAVKGESTRDSGALVSGITAAVDTDQPLLSSAEQLQLLEQFVAGVTLQDLHEAFTSDFKNGTYAYVISLPPAAAGQALPSEDEVLATANAAWQKQNVATTQESAAVAILPAGPTPGRVVSRSVEAPMGLTTVVFDNGVVLHHRFNDYNKDQVLAQVVLPGGVLEETAANHGISSAASLVLERPATSRLTSRQIRDLLSDKNVTVGGAIGLDSLSIGVNGSPADLPIGLELVNALLTDGRLEQPALDEWKQSSLQSLRAKPRAAEPQLGDAMSATVMGGDPRFAPFTPEIVQRQQCDAAQAWFDRIARHAAIEVSVVGDISEDKAVALVGKYLGSLPRRTGTFTDLDPLRHITRDPGPYVRTVTYKSVEPKALVMGGFVGCDEHDPRRRPLSLASLILTTRMIQHLRFDQQLVYSISCSATPSRGMPGTGTIVSSTSTDPRNADKLTDEIVSLVKDFAATGPSDDELAAAKKQIANQLASQMKTPGFQMAQVNMLEYHHRTFGELEEVPAIFQTLTTAQVRDAVREFATDDRLIHMEVLPEGTPSVPTSKPSTGPAPVGVSAVLH